MEFTSEINVELVSHTGSDAGIAAAARVSTGMDLSEYSEAQNTGLINYLVKNRHGSPFEHNLMTFRVQAPIFLFREWHRHRIGWSYNETSGRYKVLPPKFYVYPEGRPLVQAGSGAHPDLVHGDKLLALAVAASMEAAYQQAWLEYEDMLEMGVANEVARAVLPVGIYSEMYATCNARSLMSFLSLRVDDPTATFASKPQWEIQQAALQMEAAFAQLFPATLRAFNANGRVAP